MEEKSNRETHKSKEKEKAKNPINKYRIRVVIFSFIVFIISCYFIYLTLTEDKSTSNLQINWRITTIIRLIISSFGYIGAVLKNKRLLIITIGLILIDLILSFGIYLLSFNKIWYQYDEHVQYLGGMQNRTLEFDERDCHLIKQFGRRVIETLILVSFNILYMASIIGLIYCIEKSKHENPNEIQTEAIVLKEPHPKWALLSLSAFHIFYAIYIFMTKIFRNDDILAKKHFLHIFLWSLLALLSVIISVVGPLAVIKIKQNKLVLNFFISTILSSTALAFSNFLIILYKEIFSTKPENDYFCSIRLTSVDNLGSIFALMVINKMIIVLIFILSYEIKLHSFKESMK